MAIIEILDSPYVDFQVSPQCYGSLMRSIGEPCLHGCWRKRTSSRQTCDHRGGHADHVQDKAFGHTFVDTPAQSVSVLSRDFSKIGIGLRDLVLRLRQHLVLDPLIVEMPAKLRVRSRGGDFGSASRSSILATMRHHVFERGQAVLFMRTRSRCSGANQPYRRSAGVFKIGIENSRTTRYISSPTCTTRLPNNASLSRSSNTAAIILWFFAPGIPYAPAPS